MSSNDKLLQLVLQILHVIVAKGLDKRSGKPDSGDDGWMIQRIAQNSALLVDQRLDIHAVGCKTHAESNSGLAPDEAGHEFFQLQVDGLCSEIVTRAAVSHAEFVDGVDWVFGARAEFLREPQVVVGTLKRKHLLYEQPDISSI